MGRGLDTRLQKLERRIQPARSVVIINGADEADCERQLQEMRAAGLPDNCVALMYSGASPRILARLRKK
jgi:hypothetical protein